MNYCSLYFYFSSCFRECVSFKSMLWFAYNIYSN